MIHKRGRLGGYYARYRASCLLCVILVQAVHINGPSLTNGIIEDQSRLLVDDNVSGATSQVHGFERVHGGGRNFRATSRVTYML